MADDRSITGRASADDDVHDDDELAEVLAAELERYATGAVPVLPRSSPARQDPLQPLAVPRLEPQRRPPVAPDVADPRPVEQPRPVESAFARRAAEVEQAMRDTRPTPTVVPITAPGSGADEVANTAFRRSDRPSGRRSATGPVVQPAALPTADDLPVKRRTGFRPPPVAAPPLPLVEPLDRVLPTGPVTLPEPTASLLDSMIADSIAADSTPTGSTPAGSTPNSSTPARPTPADSTTAAVPGGATAGTPSLPTGSGSAHAARHAAPLPDAVTGPAPEGLGPTGPLALPDRLYEDWEQSLRSIGRPRSPWEIDDEVVPTGGDANLPTVALPVQQAGPRWRPPAEEKPAQPDTIMPPQGYVAPDGPAETRRRRRAGRRRAAAPDDASPEETMLEAVPGRAEPGSAPTGSLPTGSAPNGSPRTGSASTEGVPAGTVPAPTPSGDAPARFLPPAALPPAAFAEDVPRASGVRARDVDEEGIDDVAVDYPVVSAATTGAIDLPQLEARPRTAPVFIERVRTAILQLPSVPVSPTGSGAAAIVGRWVGAFASPLLLVLAFGLAGAGGGSAAGPAVVAGALLAVPAIARSVAWSARAADDAAMQEVAVLGARAGRVAAVLLLLIRLGGAAAVLFLAGTTVGAWADRTGALGLTTSDGALVGVVAVGVLATFGVTLSARATAALTLVFAVLGAIGTLLVALVLAPTGGAPTPVTASGAVAGAVAGFVVVGLLIVLCGADIARWRTDHANAVSTVVGSVVAVLCGGVLIAAGSGVAARLTGGGDPVDEFVGTLSDASATLLAGPILLVLLLSALTLPALLLRSAGASAARLLGDGRPVRLGAVGAGLLSLAGALGLLVAGADPTGTALAAAALCGVPVAAWAGLLVTTSSAGRPVAAAAGLAAATIVGWLLCDGLVPGMASPLLDALRLPASTGLRGGPGVGVAVALLLGCVCGAVGGRSPGRRPRPPAGPADTVEG